jgi:hypothetical protein
MCVGERKRTVKKSIMLTRVNKAVTVSKSRLHDIADMSRNCACLIEWSPVGDHPSHPSFTQPLQSACSLHLCMFSNGQPLPCAYWKKVCSRNTINTQSIPNDRDLFAPAPTGDPHSRDPRPGELRRYRRRAPSVFSQKPPDDRARTAEDWRVRYHCHILSFAAGSSSSQRQYAAAQCCPSSPPRP